MGQAAEFRITDFTDRRGEFMNAHPLDASRVHCKCADRGTWSMSCPRASACTSGANQHSSIELSMPPPCVHFLTLSHDEQAAAIRRLASLGFGDYEIAQRTGWHVIEVRRALAAHRERIDFTYAR